MGDLGGFVAAIFMRGIPYVQVPTTFLAQVDSSVGGKTGVNLPEGKNLVGNFLQPLAVFADIGVLGTLPDRELRAGLMESVKAGIIRDRALVRYMEEHAEEVLGRDPKALEKVIAASIRMKAGVVQPGRARERAAHDFELRPHSGPRAGAGDRYKSCCTARRWGGGWWLRWPWRAAGNDHRRANGANGEADRPLRPAADTEAARGAKSWPLQAATKKCWRGEALRASGGHWRRRRGGGCTAAELEAAVKYMLGRARPGGPRK